MIESTRQEEARVRFDVLPDGTVEGNDGAGGQLAATLRYVCRMASQIGALLELGELERVTTLSSLPLTARVSGVAPDLHIKAQVAPLQRQITHVAPSSAAPPLSAQELIRQAVKRVTIDLGSDWAAFITDEGRLVGAAHDIAGRGAAPDELREVGVRALAILGAFDPALVGAAVRLDLVRGSMLVSPVGVHAVFAHTDNVDVSEVVRTITAVTGLLAGAQVKRADLVTESRPA